MISDQSRFIPRVCYEIFVRSFCDSNGDSIGDLNGITEKLNYLHDLGIEAIWLTPIHPSPTYHKYDVTDYYGIEPEYGSMDDFKKLLHEAHARNMHIYLDLIVNHTSTLHPWFEEARKGADNPFRDFYWWMTPEQIDTLGIKRRETSDDSQVVYPWHDNPGDAEKYYGLFFKGMPDLNYHSEALKGELEKIVRFWLADVGVDGFRLDAARHIFPEWEKDSNVGFWQFFSEVKEKINPDAFTVAEVWAETEEVAPYFSYLDATFHFDLSFALQDILVNERDENLIEKLLTSYALFKKFNPNFIDAIMLTNHDQDRIGSVLGGHPGKLRLAATILLTLPGQPYIYYGEEIGMLGAKPDTHIREPFLWAESGPESEKNTRWIEPRFTMPATVAPLSEQKADPHSLYQHYRKLIQIRKSWPALNKFFETNLVPVDCHDERIMAFLRTCDKGDLLIIHNLSGYEMQVQLPDWVSTFRAIIFSTEPDHPAQWNGRFVAPYSSLILSHGSPQQ